MEIWLKENSNALRIPILPPEVEIPTETLINTININEIGEVALFGGNKLSRVSLSSFFPNQVYSFVEYSSFPKPYEFVKKIEAWRKEGKPIRLVITGANINIQVLIEKFSYKEKDGSGDVYYTIEFVEYKTLTITKIANTVKPAPIAPPPPPRPSPPPQRTHTVVRGDSMWAIANRYYNNGSRYPEIYKANKKVIDDKNRKTGCSKYTIYSGQVFIIP